VIGCFQPYLAEVVFIKTFIAGGAGFIGSHLTDALLNKGFETVCIDNFLLGTRENIEHLQEHPRFVFYERDICDLPGLREIFEKESIDCVFHLAANSDIQAGGSDPAIDFNNTYTTTFNLLECMRIYGVKKLFFSSTSAIYGDQSGKLLYEDMGQLNPVSYYGAAKLGSEALISASSALNGISALIFRFPNVIGPRLTHGVIFDFIKKLRDDPAKLRILGDGRQTKPYMYVDDLIDGILRFMDVTQGMSIYNIGVDTSTCVTRIADMVCAGLRLQNVRYEYTGGRIGWPGDVPEFMYDLSKINAAGWTARYTSDEAVERTVRELCGR